MENQKTILITGAAGNLGSKLRDHLRDRYHLVLLDWDAKGDPDIISADLSLWHPVWLEAFKNVPVATARGDVVVHLAANPAAGQSWESVIGPNIDAVINVFTAAAQAGVQRIVYASSNHAMGGYKDLPTPQKLTTDIPPYPGTHFERGGKARDSIPYGSAKFMGERLGKCYADIYGLSCIAVRIGWTPKGENRATDIPVGREDWFRLMWLSNRDYCQLMACCIEASFPRERALPFISLWSMVCRPIAGCVGILPIRKSW